MVVARVLYGVPSLSGRAGCYGLRRNRAVALQDLRGLRILVCRRIASGVPPTQGRTLATAELPEWPRTICRTRGPFVTHRIGPCLLLGSGDGS